MFYSALFNPPGTQAIRPNTPVLPYASALSTATFIDPSARLVNGNHIVLGTKTLVAPYATLDAASGFIKIGTGSAVLDNATIAAAPSSLTVIGDDVQIGYGATIVGSAVIGAFGTAAKATGVGPNAVIEPGAVIKPGAVVGALAHVGSGVTVPSGIYVKPGANVTTDAQASNPALGMVEALPASIKTDLTTELTRNAQLAAGYTNLYQGNSATGASLGTTATGIFNGNLAAVEGSSQEPGASTTTATTGITFEPTKATGPKFLGPFMASVEGNIPIFKSRVIGDVRFTNARASAVQLVIGKVNSIRADQGQPISFASPPATGRNVTITSPLGGTVTMGTTTITTGAIKVGTNFHTGNNVVVLGGSAAAGFKIGDNVTIDTDAVVSGSSLGANVTIGARSYVANSTIASNTIVPAGTIIINNVVVGSIQW